MTISQRVNRAANIYIISGHPIRYIADELGVSASTIYNDLMNRAYTTLPADTYNLIRKRAKSNSAEVHKHGKVSIMHLDTDASLDDESTFITMKEFIEDNEDEMYPEVDQYDMGKPIEWDTTDDLPY